MPRKLDPPLLLALLIPSFAMLPFVQNAGMPNVADGVIHLLRQVDFDRALRDGALVPRWGADLYGGFGYPLYVFAPPLLAYGVELFHGLGLTMAHALKLCVLLTIELYSVGMFLFMRPKVGAYGALIAAALNVYAPFRLREAIVTGGNYPQFLAMSLFPLILWALDGFITTRTRKYLIASALSYGALILSHVFHALSFTPVIVGYVLLRLLTTRAPWRVWGLTLLAGVLGLLLSAFFGLPLFLEQPWVRATAEAFQQASDFRLRFLSWTRLGALPLPLNVNEANADVPFSLGLPQLIVGVLGMASVVWRLTRKRQPTSWCEPLFLFCVCACSVFLQLPSSLFLWRTIPMLPIAEYPWRFMGISAFALAALGGYSVMLWRDHDVRGVLPTLIIALTLACAFPYTIASRGFWQLDTPMSQDVLSYEQATGAYGLTTLNEYLPQTVQAIPADLPAPLSRAKIDVTSLPPQSIIAPAHWSPHSERDTLTLTQPANVRFRIFSYPGWVAYVDGNAAPITTLHDGTISVSVPAGQHHVELRFETTPTRRISEWVSLLTLIVLLGIAFNCSNAFIANSILIYEFARAGFAIQRLRPRIPNPPRTEIPINESGNRYKRSVADDQIPLRERTPTVSLRWLVGALLLLGIIKIGVIDIQDGLHSAREMKPIAIFGEQLALIGSEVDEATISRGDELHTRFFWRVMMPLQNDYRVIAQLVAADGRAITGTDKQHAGDPVVQGETPTSQIPLDQYLRDEHTIPIPTNIAIGRYELRVGWYDGKTGKRLRLPDGETLFKVSDIEIK
jgi:hypothetical protein